MASIEVNTILGAPQISIKNVIADGFTIVVNNNYAEGLITEYKYYVGGELKSPSNTTTKEYEVIGLTDETKYENIYVEAYIDTMKMQSNTLTATTLSAWSEAYSTTALNNYEDKAGKKATVPAGYQVSLITGQTEIENGLVIRNVNDKNEFVWVPCTIDGANGSIKYARYSWTNHSNSGYSETMPSDEQTSVNTYGGFYIGRYETGIEGYTNLNTGGNALDEYTGYTGGKAVIQKGQQVWNYITRDKAKKVSQELYSKTKEDSVNSKLCSSYAWDTALNFIETKVPTYPTNSVGGYYGQSVPTKTGYDTTHPCNIYDMGGNTREWTSEYSGNGSNPCTKRGGQYNNNAGSTPAATRDKNTSNTAHVSISFRTTLYL